MTRLPRLLATLALCACAHSGRAHSQDVGDPMATMPPMGMGSLTQEQISVGVGNNQLTVRFTPLNERLLRLLAPDAYRALAGLVARRRAAIDSVSRSSGTAQPGLMLVTVYGNVPDVRFDPTLIGASVNGRRIDPVGIIPLDANFSRQQLPRQAVGMGLFVFSEELPVYSPMVFTYGVAAAEGWAGRIQTFDRELARVSARERSQATEQVPDTAPTPQ
ncbi:MAG TPA: hypothetical protein VFV65_00790 [Gemmatimonadales bacterium]|nr:hypothetical protein [Gemmatimonadales bacterium]